MVFVFLAYISRGKKIVLDFHESCRAGLILTDIDRIRLLNNKKQPVTGLLK